MYWRTLILGAVGMASVLGTSLVMSEPASARPACMYIARDPMGNVMADGYAWAMKELGLQQGPEAMQPGARAQEASRQSRPWPLRPSIELLDFSRSGLRAGSRDAPVVLQTR